jgi:cold shock CspA family protein
MANVIHTKRETGTVISFRREGYGWLQWSDLDGTDNTVWIHVQDTKNKQGRPLPALRPGWKIQFDVVETPRGLRARNAIVVDTAIPNEVIPCPQTT